jgi:hypothetical protein
VLSPMLIAALICITAVMAMARVAGGERLAITPVRVGVVVLGGLLALYVFMSDALHALLAGRTDWDTLRPESFKWPLFLMALALMALPSLMATWPGRKARPQTTRPKAPLMREPVE